MPPAPFLPFRPLLCLLASASLASAIDFEKEIRPLLEDRCLDCHDQDTKKGGVALDSFYASTLPTDSGEKILVPRQPDHSLLLQRVTATDPKLRMPPKGKPLSPSQIETLRTWIAEGAPWPDDGWRPKAHWAYVAPTLPAVPDSGKSTATIRTPIDSFIHAKLASKGILPNPDADPAVQLRRISLDLTGLPPTVEEVDAFLADPSEAAYAAQVDRLLASPAFGERWARHWLDAARYADSEGYQRDELRSVWPWRDWVIRALNADLPFDQFTIEQLAGDLLPNATQDQKIATGFQRNTPLNLEAGTDPAEDHYKQVVDRLNTVGSVWLGSTVGCAQCHNHKYDPLTIGDYYRLFAFFNQTPFESARSGKGAAMAYTGPDLSLARDPVSNQKADALEKQQAAALAKLKDHCRAPLKAAADNPDRASLFSMETLELLDIPDSKKSLADYQALLKPVLKDDPKAAQFLKAALALQKKLEPLAAIKTRVMVEMDSPRPTAIAKRGDFLAPGDPVQAGVPEFLGTPLPPASSGTWNRLDLARWLVNPTNPLTARVTVNRIWAELFGTGIVPTLEEFGKQGEPPSHPELLDWLAVTFAKEDQWSLKKTLRRIVLSSTYRRSATLSPQGQEADPANVLLGRHPGHRLDAETIRDAALAVSGLLSRKMGGPPCYPPQPDGVWRQGSGAGPSRYEPSTGEDRYRRGIYTVWKRKSPYPAFTVFDAPDRGACVLQRGRSNTPLQALVLLNDEAFVEAAHALARRCAAEFTGDPPERLRHAFRTVLARQPSATELQTLHQLYQDAIRAGADPENVWFDVATLLLNLHETIHRG